MSKENEKLLFILFLNKDEFLEDILTLFLELGISGATILDSIGMGRILSHDIPIFAGFRELFGGNRPHNRTILTVIKKDIIKDLADGIEKICGSFNDPGTGLFITIPINQAWGLREDFPS